MNKVDMVHILTHTLEYHLAIKRWNLAMCNMDGPWEYYAKWNKSDREIQILSDFPPM